MHFFWIVCASFAFVCVAPPAWRIPIMYELDKLEMFWTQPSGKSLESNQQRFRKMSRKTSKFSESGHIIDTIVSYIQTHGLSYVIENFVNNKSTKRPKLRDIYILMQSKNQTLIRVLPIKYSIKRVKELWTKGDKSIGLDKPLNSWKERTNEYPWSHVPSGYKHLAKLIETLDEIGYDAVLEQYCKDEDFCPIRAAYVAKYNKKTVKSKDKKRRKKALQVDGNSKNIDKENFEPVKKRRSVRRLRLETEHKEEEEINTDNETLLISDKKTDSQDIVDEQGSNDMSQDHEEMDVESELPFFDPSLTDDEFQTMLSTYLFEGGSSAYPSYDVDIEKIEPTDQESENGGSSMPYACGIPCNSYMKNSPFLDNVPAVGSDKKFCPPDHSMTEQGSDETLWDTLANIIDLD